MGVEWIGARDIDEAVELLAKHPSARIGRVYVMPAITDPEAEEES